jgi:hypothetical protein
VNLVRSAAVIVGLGVAPMAGADPACAPLPAGHLLADPPPILTDFGRALDVEGDRLIVGDPGYDPPGGTVNTGGAFIFTRLGDDWRQDAVLTLSGIADLDDLGWAAVIEGDSAVISTPFNRRNEGEAFAFRREPSGEWILEANIKHDPKTTPRLFGISMDYSGGVLAIGGLLNDDDPAGWVDLYARFDTRWVRRAHIVPHDGVALDEFGHSVALDGDRLIVGAPGHETTVFGGAAYIFRKSDEGWTFEQKLVPPGLRHGDRAGTRVALHRGLAAVAAPPASGGSGRVWTYVLTPDGWILDAILRDPSGGLDRSIRFGDALALRGDRLIVGAPETTGGAGAVYVYHRVDDAWITHGRILAAQASAPDTHLRAFGRAVAVDGTGAFASAPATTILPSGGPGISTGAVARISLEPPSFGVTRQPADLDAAPGGNLVLAVRAEGPGPLAYRWFRAGVPVFDSPRVSGSHSPTLTLLDTTLEDSALYSAQITSPSCGRIESRRALIDLGGCPRILSDPPETQSLLGGDPLILHSDVDAPIASELRWFAGFQPLEDDGRISGSHTPTLTITPTLPGDSTIYYLTIKSPCGQIESEVASVSFESCVSIVRGPEPVFTFIGDVVRFEAAAAATHLPLTYLWFRNGLVLSDGGRFTGTGTARLSIYGAQSTDAGDYSCLVSCGFNSESTQPARLTLHPQNCLGDANLDRRIDMIDISTILEFWGRVYRPDTGQGDADRDGLVNFDDLSIVLSRFGDPCN